MQQSPEVDEAYFEWVMRLRATAESVAFCCVYLLNDRELSDVVGARVVAGLIGKPGIFKYSGLPFSGRVARHTERGLAQAKAGELPLSGTWEQLQGELEQVPLGFREVMVHAWVDDRSDEELVDLLQCRVDQAIRRREESLAFW